MPWPPDPTPVRAERRGAVWVLVDSKGKKLPEQPDFRSEESANAAAERINASWKRAKDERDRKLREATEIREQAALNGDGFAFVRARARELTLREAYQEWQHPRNREGEWRDKFSLQAEAEARLKTAFVHQLAKDIDVIKQHQKSVVDYGLELDDWDNGYIAGSYVAMRIARLGGGRDEIAAEAKKPHVVKSDEYEDGWQTGMRGAALLWLDLNRQRWSLARQSPGELALEAFGKTVRRVQGGWQAFDGRRKLGKPKATLALAIVSLRRSVLTTA